MGRFSFSTVVSSLVGLILDYMKASMVNPNRFRSSGKRVNSRSFLGIYRAQLACGT